MPDIRIRHQEPLAHVSVDVELQWAALGTHVNREPQS